jgi:hypothetical protein
VRERVVGASVEDEGDEVDGTGRELIVVAVGRSRWPRLTRRRRGSKSVTGGVSRRHASVTRNEMCVCRIFIGKARNEDLCYPIVPV